MDSKSGNDTTDERRRGIVGENPNDEETASQIETDIDC